MILDYLRSLFNECQDLVGKTPCTTAVEKVSEMNSFEDLILVFEQCEMSSLAICFPRTGSLP